MAPSTWSTSTSRPFASRLPTRASTSRTATASSSPGEATTCWPGLRLGILLEDAGLEVERYRCASSVWGLPVGMRGPHWAARAAMVEDGIASASDLERWDEAFERLDARPIRPWTFVPLFVAVGRRPS